MSKILTVWFLFTLALSSCSNKVEEVAIAEQNSPVSVGPVEIVGNYSLAASEPQFWNEIKNNSKIDLKVCLKDRASLENLVEEPFDVVDQMGRVVSKNRQTDHLGCLYWTVSQNFDFLNQERYFHKNYRIRSMGAFAYNKSIKLGFNPWSGEVIDLARQKDHQQVNVKALSILRPFENLYIEDVSIQKIEQASSEFDENQNELINYQISFYPKYRRKDLNGDFIQANNSITNGRFELEMSLVEYDLSKEEYFEIGKGRINEFSAQQGQVDQLLTLRLFPGAISSRDNPTFIRINLYPIGNEHFNEFEGVQYMIGISALSENQLVSTYQLKTSMTKPSFNFINLELKKPSFDVPVVTPSPVANLENDSEEESDFEIIEVNNSPEELNISENRTDRIKFQEISFADQGNVNRFDNYENADRVRRVDIQGILFDELSGSNGAAINSGEFHIAVELVSSQTKDRYDSERYSEVLSTGAIDTFVYLPYNLYGIEKNIHFDLILTGQSGKYKNRVIRKRLAYNPWSKRGFDTDRLPPEEIENAKFPQIKLSNLELQWPRIDFQDNMVVDRHMNLGFNLDFHTTLELHYDHGRNIGEDADDPAIEFGDYAVEAFLFTPKRDNVSYYQSPNYQMNIDDFKLVTTSKSEGRIVKGVQKGFLEVKLSFPFSISEMPIQHLKNLLVLHVKPLDGNNTLRPLTIATPFSARAKHQSETHLGHKDNLYENIRASMGHYEELMEDGLRFKMKRVLQETASVDSLEVYRKKMKDDFKEQFYPLEWNDFRDEVTKTQSDLRSGHFRDIHRGRDSRYTLAKSACTYHFNKTIGLQTQRVKNDYANWRRLSELFNDCLRRPLDHFQVVPTAHIVSVLDEKEWTYGKNSLAKAHFINQIPYQEIQKGRTFFAGNGERIASGSGTREADQLVLSAKISAESPAPFYLNMSMMKNKVYEAYEFQSKHNYLFDANRHYQTIINNAEYEMLEVQFNAEVKKCVKIFNERSAYHICYPNTSRQDITEKWFQISTEYHQGERGIITDGEIHQGQSSGYQLIRGSFNFASQWNTYMSENRLMVEDITEKIEIPRDFESNDEFAGQENIPYESLIQNAFPGVYIQPIQSLNAQ